MRFLRRVATVFPPALVFFFALASHPFQSSAPAAPPASQPTTLATARPLTVMSFNIRYGTANDGPNHWKHRRDHVVTTIRKYAPDVIGMQEALRFQLDELRAALPGFDEFGVGRDDGKQEGEYAAILFDRRRFERLNGGTFWLSDTPDVVCSKTWGNGLCRICTWAYFRDRTTGESFYLYNVHLDHISAPSRLKSAELLLKTIAARDPVAPVIVTGDFNAGERSEPIVAMKAKPEAPRAIQFVDTFRVKYAGEETVGTFNSWVGMTHGEKIDYVFTDADGFSVLEAGIARDQFDGAYPSDHFPVWATLAQR